MPDDPHVPEIPQPPPDAEAAAYPSVEELGHLLPQYEIHEIIGVGGMGAVYKGRQMALDRWVAIKVLPIAASQNAEDTQRFITEARAMAKLVHPHIVAVFDFGQTYQRHLFLVMEYVEGMDLHLRTRAGDVTPQKAREVISQLCDALQFAHEHGVAHRDIKPANILITNDWKVKVADFGLARDLSADPNADEPEYGTPDYTAPERLIIGAVVDHRADIYALGVVIHEMLTGKTPTAAGERALKDLPLGFAGVISKCLMAEPERRYQKASDVKIALLTATSDSAIKTGSTAKQEAKQAYAVPEEFSTYQPPRFVAVKRGLPVLGWGLACVLLVGAFAWFLLKDKVSFESPAPEILNAKTEGAKVEPEPSKPTEPEFVGPPTPAVSAVEVTVVPPTEVPTPPMTTPKVVVEMEDPVLVPKDLPKAPPYSVPEGPLGEVMRLDGHVGSVYDVEILQDEHRVVSTGVDGTLRVWDLHTQKEILHVDDEIGQLQMLQVDADDSRALIYSTQTDQLAMVDLTTGKITHKVKFPDNTLSNVVLMPAAKTVLVGGANNDGKNNLYLWQLEEGAELNPVEGYSGRPYAMALGQDGQSVIISSSQIVDAEKKSFRPVVSLFSAQTGQFSPLEVSNLGYITRFHEVRSATQLLARGSSLAVVNRSDMKVSFSLPKSKPDEPSLLTGQVADNGRLLLTGWSDRTLRAYEVSSGDEVWRETTSEPVTDMSLSKDQRWAVFSTRFKDPKNTNEGDFDLLVWRMPKWDDLQSPSKLEATIALQMAELAKHDPELASMRENLLASFPLPDKAEWAAQKQKLDVLYVSALRRQIPGLSPTEQKGVQQEVELIISGRTLPDKNLDVALPVAAQKLRGIYRDQLLALVDKQTQAVTIVRQTVEGYLLPLKRKREAANDRLAVGRLTALLKEWTVTSDVPSTPAPETTPLAQPSLTATPTKRPDRPGNVIVIQRTALNTSPMMPPPQVGRVPRDLGAVVAIAGGAEHVIALLPDGQLRAWGTWGGQPMVLPSAAKDVVQIDSSDLTAVALCRDGKVVCWGSSTAEKPTLWASSNGKIPLHVYAGSRESGYVQCTDGSIEPIGQIDPAAPTTLGPVAKLQYFPNSGGWCAILQNGGTPVYWGAALSPVLPLPPEMRDLFSIGISTAYGVALQRDGTMTGWGQLAQNQRFRIRKFTGGTEIFHDYAGRVFPVHRTDHSWELAPNPSIPEYIAEDRSSVVEGRLRSCIDAIFTKEYVIGLKP
ncbi:MAG: protein kinase [Verrucomicrobia bacterium]|nr:protein kinase [Verrucomicrobiota bacterium]